MPTHAGFPWDRATIALVACVVVMALGWLRQLRTRDATSVDVLWTTLVGGTGLWAAATGDGDGSQRMLAGAIALAWGLRLGGHLYLDRVRRADGEDGRYRALRERLGPDAAVRFAWVYLAQAALAWLFALPFLALAEHGSPAIAPGQWVGVGVFALAQVLEAIADRQLAEHRRDPSRRRRTCRTGLWRWSRHPNYFAEWLSWCGIGLLASPAPGGALALAAPAAMFVLVRFVTGVPFAEQQALRSRGDDYRHYIATTNAFFPWRSRAADPRP